MIIDAPDPDAMVVAGILIWADESPAWLATATAGFARFCDEIVAVDGFYALYPGAHIRSRPDQAEAVMAAAEAAGVGCTVHRPRGLFWGNEVEKRNLSLQLAAPFLTPGRDWVCVFDADYHVYQAYPEQIRHTLETTATNVVSYTILDGKDLLAHPATSWLAAEHGASSEWTARTRDLYRWTPDLRYGPAHYCVRGTYDERTEWLRGPEMVLPDDQWAEPADCTDLDAALVVHHRTQHRVKDRRDAADGYYRSRDLAKVEQITADTVNA